MNPQSAMTGFNASNPTAQFDPMEANMNIPSNFSAMNGANSVLGSMNSPAPKVTTPSSSQPNLIERLLPTIGSIGGGLLGGALDIGTAGLAAPLTIGLAGAGGALGRAAENALTGQKVLQGNVLGSGVEGAVGQGIGMGIGSLLGKAGEALGGLASKATGAAAKGALQDSVNGVYNDVIGHTSNNLELNDGVIEAALKRNGITDAKLGDAIKADINDQANAATNFKDIQNMRPMMVSAANPVMSKIPNAIDLAGMGEAFLGHNPVLGLGTIAANHLLSNPAVLSGAGGVISNLGPKIAPVASQVVANSPSMVGQPSADTSIGANMQNPLQNSLLSTEIQTALAMPTLGGLQALGGLVPQAQKAAEAENAVQGLANEFNQAGGAQGPIGGLLSRIGSTFTGGPAAQYGKQASQTAEAISRATGIPVAQVEAALPQLTQNQSAAELSLNNIASLLSALGGGPAPHGSVMSAL